MQRASVANDPSRNSSGDGEALVETEKLVGLLMGTESFLALAPRLKEEKCR